MRSRRGTHDSCAGGGRRHVSRGAFSIAGGGDTLAAIAKYRIGDRISYISTGGGAFLEFLEGKTLPAIAILEERAARRAAGLQAWFLVPYYILAGGARGARRAPSFSSLLPFRLQAEG